MEALEFKSKIKNNRILVPKKIQSKLGQDKKFRILVLIEDENVLDDMMVRETTKKQFLKGYASSDSIYDDY